MHIDGLPLCCSWACLSIHVVQSIVFNHGHCVVHSHFCPNVVAMTCNECSELANFRARPVGAPFKWWCHSCYAKMEMDANVVEYDVEVPPLCCDCGEAPATMRIQSEDSAGLICKYWCYACQRCTDEYDDVPHKIYDLESASESDQEDESDHEVGDTAAQQQQPDPIFLGTLQEQLELEAAIAKSLQDIDYEVGDTAAPIGSSSSSSSSTLKIKDEQE